MAWEITIGEQLFQVDIESADAGSFRLRVDGEVVEVDARFPEPGVLHLIRDGEAFELDIHPIEGGQDVTLYGTRYSAAVVDEREKVLRTLGLGSVGGSGTEFLSSSMPGKVVAVLVEEGQQVVAGSGLVVVEAMKMENELCCSRDGVVAEILVAVGDTVEGGTTLLRVTPLEDA